MCVQLCAVCAVKILYVCVREFTSLKCSNIRKNHYLCVVKTKYPDICKASTLRKRVVWTPFRQPLRISREDQSQQYHQALQPPSSIRCTAGGAARRRACHLPDGQQVQEAGAIQLYLQTWQGCHRRSHRRYLHHAYVGRSDRRRLPVCAALKTGDGLDGEKRHINDR